MTIDIAESQVGYVSRVAMPIYHPRTFLTSAYQGTLGAGFATAIGAKVAHPDKQVLSINGDGGFMYNVQELATAVKYNIPVVAIVFADGAYGNVRRMQQELYDNRTIASDLTNPDFVALAERFQLCCLPRRNAGGNGENPACDLQAAGPYGDRSALPAHT